MNVGGGARAAARRRRPMLCPGNRRGVASYALHCLLATPHIAGSLRPDLGADNNPLYA